MDHEVYRLSIWVIVRDRLEVGEAPEDLRHHSSPAGQLVRVCVRDAHRVEATGAEGPECDFRLVDAVLLRDPVEQRGVEAVWRFGIRGRGGAVAGAGDFEDQGRDAVLAPAFHPDGEFGAVAVEAREDYEEWGGRGWRCGGGEEVVGGDCGAFVGEAVGMRDLDFVDGVGAEAVFGGC